MLFQIVALHHCSHVPLREVLGVVLHHFEVVAYGEVGDTHLLVVVVAEGSRLLKQAVFAH